MKDICLLIEAIKNVSDDKIIDAVSFAIRAEAVGNHLVVAMCALVVLYGLYRLVKSLASYE